MVLALEHADGSASDARLAGPELTPHLLPLYPQGFVVLALEHADGTASTARLAGPGLTWQPWARESCAQARGRWRWYRGLGDGEAQVRGIGGEKERAGTGGHS